jgi:hypothetical protein
MDMVVASDRLERAIAHAEDAISRVEYPGSWDGYDAAEEQERYLREASGWSVEGSGDGRTRVGRLTSARPASIDNSCNEEDQEMIKVTSEVSIVEVNGNERKPGDGKAAVLTVSSHWCYSSQIVLRIADDAGVVEVTISARDLQAAIANATNVCC